MTIEELENELKNLKVEAYDLNSKYVELTQKISNIENEIKKLNESEKKDEVTVVEEQPVEEAVAPVIPAVEEQPVEDTAPVIPAVEEQLVEEATPVIPAVEEQPVEEAAPVIPAVEEQPVEEATPVIPAVEEQPVEEATPVIPAVEEQPVQAVTSEPVVASPLMPTVETEVIPKNDANAARGIIVGDKQFTNIENSNESVPATEAVVQDIATEPTVVQPLIPTVEAVTEPTVSEPVPAVDNKEDLNKQLEAMVNQLATTTDEAEATKLNENIKVLSNKINQAA